MRAERLIRRAARSGNRAIAGVPVVLRIEDQAVRSRVALVLERMGARLRPETAAHDAREAADAAARPLVISDDRSGAGPQRGQAAGERIEWASLHMGATREIARELAAQGVLRGERVLLSLVLEPKTAALALAVMRAGADVAVFGAVNETDPQIAAELADRGCAVFAPQREIDTVEAHEVDALPLSLIHL